MKVPKMMVLVESGAVREVEATPDAAGGWTVWIVYRHRDGERREALERQRGGVRVFATLDAVARAVASAGLPAFRVHVAGLGEEPL